MPAITDAVIRSALRQINAGTAQRLVLTDGNGRGGGRLQLQIRRAKYGPLAEWYAVQHRDNKRRLRKIGCYPQITLSAARELFLPFSAKIRQGSNVQSIRGGTDTFEAMLRGYVETIRDQRTKTNRERLFFDSPDAICSHVGGKRRACEITASDISDWLRIFYDRGSRAGANENRKAISAAFGWAMKSSHDYKTSTGVNYHLTANPVAAIPSDPGASNPGTRFLSPDEFRAFLPWLQARKGCKYRVLEMLALTGQRIDEIVSITPSHRQDGGIYWNNTKAGRKDGNVDRPHFIPLPARCVTILDEQKPTREMYLFSVRGRDVIREACKEFAEEYGFDTFTTRDLRRTWKTLAGLAGVSKEDRDRYQNHASDDVSSRHYDRYRYLREKKQVVQQWEQFIDDLMQGHDFGQV